MSQDPRSLVTKADKLLAKAGGGFSLFGGREDKYQEAADALIQAANAFRMQKLLTDAGRTFERAAEVQKNNLNDPDDAANTLVDAFKAYKADDPARAAVCLDAAILQYCSKGNFRRAAVHKEKLAELYETDLNDVKKALQSYEAAAEWYEGDSANNLANKLWLKVAELAALQGDYAHAVRNFEKVADHSIRSDTMKYSVKDYFLRAGLCHIAVGDDVETQLAIDRYQELDQSFVKEREYSLLVALAEARREMSPESLADALAEYDRISRLDKWKTTICLRIRKAIEATVEEEFN